MSGIAYGDDAGTRNEARGLSYHTLMIESTAQAELFILKQKRGFNRRGNMTWIPRLRPYIFAGGGGICFNPSVEDLTPDSNGTGFKKIAPVMIGGAGFIYGINREWFLGAELGGRLITTDYLDGYTSSASKSNDLYYIATVNLIYQINPRAWRRR